MGVTVHFEGSLRDEDAYLAAIASARQFAEQLQWPMEVINEDETILQRVRDEEKWDYVGPVKGLAIQPHENSDPLRLEFERSLYVQEYIKTQFAPLQTHIDVIRLLKTLSPYFRHLEVDDEGEYFETENVSLLEAHFSDFFHAFNEQIKENARLYGPVRIRGGRIVDLMERVGNLSA